MLRSLPPLAQLRAYAALVETGSMSAAGALLNVSHAAISQQVRALEASLGVTLFQRVGRRVELTAEGARLGQTLREAFGSIAREIEVLTGADADRPLQITTTPTVAAAWLMPRIGSFRALAPEVDLMINPTVTRVDPAPGGVDLAIRFGRGHWPGLEVERFMDADFVVAAAPTLVKAEEICGPSDLLDFPWLQEIGTTEASDWLAKHSITEKRVKSLAQVPGNLLLDGLRAGQGVAVTRRTFIEGDLERGDLVELFASNDPGQGYFLVTYPGPRRAILKTFIRWLQRERALE